MDRVLVTAQTSRTQSPAFVPNGLVYDQKLVVFAFDSSEHLALLASSIHYHWVVEYGSTLRTDAVYTPSDCFETFPFPHEVADLRSIGDQYDAERRSIMLSRGVGLTKVYNLFHDDAKSDSDTVRLRECHIAMDHAILRAYGWGDVVLNHGFHEFRQGVRFTISERARQILLAKLLALNHERYEGEVRAGLHNKRRVAALPRDMDVSGEEETS